MLDQDELDLFNTCTCGAKDIADCGCDEAVDYSDDGMDY